MKKTNKLVLRLVSIILSISLMVSVVSGCSFLPFGKEAQEDGFKAGWEAAIQFLGTEAAAVSTDEYIAAVQAAIDELQSSINLSMGSNRGIAQEAGFVAERWHAGTFNIDSVLNESIYSAEVPSSNAFGSADVIVVDAFGNEVSLSSLKYYQSASGSAAEQAATIIDRYTEYLGNHPDDAVSFQQYCEDRGYDGDISDLYPIYNGQIRIIPADQIDAAAAYLAGYADLSDGFPYAETLENLRARIEAPDGTSSTPATYEEMQAIAELAREGKFDPEDFGLSITQIITPKYVVKQAVSSGLTSAAIELVLEIGPDLFSVIRESVSSGQLDIDQLRELGIDGLLASSVGFVEGASGSLLLSACKAGKLGPNLKDISPQAVGAIVVLASQAIRYGYALSKGEITALEYGDLMAENVIVVAGAYAGGIALAHLLPALPVAYLVGSFVGGILASVGYRILRATLNQVVLFFRGAGGFETTVADTEEVADVYEIPQDNIAEADVFCNLSTAKDLSVNLDEKGAIYIGLDAEYYCPNCDAILDDMESFDPDAEYFFCEECGMLLYSADMYDGDRYPGVIWFCDGCDACLSLQEGFTDLVDEWECTECGYVSPICAEAIS